MIQRDDASTSLVVYWRDYRITRDKYQWILSIKNEVTEEVLQKIRKLKTTAKLGDVKWSEFGYYHELSQLMAVVAKHETGNMKGEIRLAEFIIMWNDILRGFAKEIEVAFEEVKEVEK